MESATAKAIRQAGEAEQRRGDVERLVDAIPHHLYKDVGGGVAAKNLYRFAHEYPAMAKRLIDMDERIAALEQVLVVLVDLVESGSPVGRVRKLLVKLGIRKNK